MSISKKVVVNLSEVLSDKFNRELIDNYKKNSKKRSKFIKEAIILYSEGKKKSDYIEKMKKGYIEMAKINLEISEMGFETEFDNLKEYEEKLSESDLPNDNDSEKRRYILC